MVAPLMALAAGPPSTKEECYGAAFQQRARMVHSGIPQILVLLRLGCRFSVDGAASDLPVEGPVRQVEVAVDDLLACPLEAQLNARGTGQHGILVRDGR